MARISNKEIMDQMATMNKMLESIVAEQKSQRMDIDALKGAKSVGSTSKNAPVEEVRVLKGRVTQNRLVKLYHEEGVRKVQIGKVTYGLIVDSDGLVSYKNAAKVESSRKNAPKTEEPKTNAKKSLKDMKLVDFEPKKYDGFYRWGFKTDGFNQKSYIGMRKAYCVYKATNGQYIDSQKAYNDGVRIDYSEGSAYFKAKEEFEKKFKYVKKSDR